MIQKIENRNRDTTIDEIHRIRQQMADKFNGDTAAILADARERQAASGRPIWHPPASGEGESPEPIPTHSPLDDTSASK